MGQYDKALAVSRKLISKYGRSLTVVRHPTAPADASKPWRGPGDVAPEVTLAVTGVFTAYSGKNPPTLSTRKSRQTVLVAPTADEDDLLPFTGINDGTDEWFVDEIEVIKPGDTTVLWKLHVSK